MGVITIHREVFTSHPNLLIEGVGFIFEGWKTLFQIVCVGEHPLAV